MKTNLRLSPSRASDFRSCPQLYKFRAVDRIPEPPSEAQLRGTITHKALEILLRLPSDERTRPRASECLNEALVHHSKDIEALVEALRSDPGPADPSDPGEPESSMGESLPPAETVAETAERLRSACEILLDNYFKIEDPKSVRAIATEKRVRAPLLSSANGDAQSLSEASESGRAELIGVIDRIDRSEPGELVLTDYKTGASPAKNYEREAFFGLRFYSVIVSKSKTHEEQPSRLRLLYLQDAQVLEEKVTPPVIDSTHKLIAAIAEAIERAHLNDDWRANPGRLCDYCYFKPICPAHR